MGSGGEGLEIIAKYLNRFQNSETEAAEGSNVPQVQYVHDQYMYKPLHFITLADTQQTMPSLARCPKPPEEVSQGVNTI